MSHYEGVCIRFLTRVMCSQQAHIRKEFYCRKHPTLLNVCNVCRKNAKSIRFAYTCANCKNAYCFTHYRQHLRLFAPLGHLITCNSEQLMLNDEFVRSISVRKSRTIALHLSRSTILFNLSALSTIETFVGYVLEMSKPRTINGISMRFVDPIKLKYDTTKLSKFVSILADNLRLLNIQYLGSLLNRLIKKLPK
jgi:hypothetical protein